MCQLLGGGAHAYELLYAAVPSSTDGEDDAAVLMAHTALPLPREPVRVTTRARKKPAPVAAGSRFHGHGHGLLKKTPGWPVKNPKLPPVNSYFIPTFWKTDPLLRSMSPSFMGLWLESIS